MRQQINFVVGTETAGGLHGTSLRPVIYDVMKHNKSRDVAGSLSQLDSLTGR